MKKFYAPCLLIYIGSMIARGSTIKELTVVPQESMVVLPGVQPDWTIQIPADNQNVTGILPSALEMEFPQSDFTFDGSRDLVGYLNPTDPGKLVIWSPALDSQVWNPPVYVPVKEPPPPPPPGGGCEKTMSCPSPPPPPPPCPPPLHPPPPIIPPPVNPPPPCPPGNPGEPPPVPNVPEPATLAMFGGGLVLLGVLRKKQQ